VIPHYPVIIGVDLSPWLGYTAGGLTTKICQRGQVADHGRGSGGQSPQEAEAIGKWTCDCHEWKRQADL